MSSPCPPTCHHWPLPYQASLRRVSVGTAQCRHCPVQAPSWCSSSQPYCLASSRSHQDMLQLQGAMQSSILHQALQAGRRGGQGCGNSVTSDLCFHSPSSIGLCNRGVSFIFKRRQALGWVRVLVDRGNWSWGGPEPRAGWVLLWWASSAQFTSSLLWNHSHEKGSHPVLHSSVPSHLPVHFLPHPSLGQWSQIHVPFGILYQ